MERGHRQGKRALLALDYQWQVQRGIDFVEEHLTEGIDLYDVSRVADVSHWHFLRMFKSLTNETLKSYIRSRRLANARRSLVASDDSMGDDHLFLEKVRIDADYLEHLHRGVSLEPELEDMPARTMVGMATRFYDVSSERNNIGDKLPLLWAGFMSRYDEVAQHGPRVAYGVIQQATPSSEQLEYVAAAQIHRNEYPVPSGMVEVEIPSATYATFEHRGLPSEIDRTVSYIYSTWLLQSGLRHTYGPDLEVYDERYQPGSLSSRVLYAIPVQPATTVDEAERNP